MLKGQVAVLSSGLLTLEESAGLLDALRASRLYRADQHSYMLYPDRLLPGFLECNIIPDRELSKSLLLTRLLQRGDRRIVTRDVNGRVHFNAAFANRSAVDEALSALLPWPAQASGEYQVSSAGGGDSSFKECPGDRGDDTTAEDADWDALIAQDRSLVLDMYEELFDHQSFTGRSGTFYKYEGLGCVYWHMVSKLLLAVQELRVLSLSATTDGELFSRLTGHYHAIREGIGVHKLPEQYGAVPLEPYSHTPSFAGVQQPGMTGQVKEDLISRRGELGVVVDAGCIGFRQQLVDCAELLLAPRTFEYFDVAGRQRWLELDKGTVAFTLCQTPVVLHASASTRIEVSKADRSRVTLDTLDLDADISAAIFNRAGEVSRLDVYMPVREPGREQH